MPWSQHSRRRRASGACFQRLVDNGGHSGEPYLTAPEYAGETEPYLNQIVVLATYMSFDELTARTKDYQTKTRAANPYSPLVNIDIDIVEWNGEIVRPTDAAAAYYRQGIARLANLSMSGAL